MFLGKSPFIIYFSHLFRPQWEQVISDILWLKTKRVRFDSGRAGGGEGGGSAASQGMFFAIFVLNRVSILSFFVLIRASIL